MIRQVGGAANGTPASNRFASVRAAAAAAVIAWLGVGLYWTLRLGVADRLYHLGTPTAVERARRLAPSNAAYFASASAGREALYEAVSRNPRLSSAWIDLGLLAETEGNPREAERCLLEAARVDASYKPRWSLANFYFRRGENGKFWLWGRLAADMAYYTQTPLFRLYWQVTQEPEVILERGIPPRGNVLAQYLHFLLTENRPAAAEQAAQRLIPGSTTADLPVLLLYCDRSIAAGRVDAALAAWNALCGRGLLPYHALDPQRGLSITNGDFGAPPLGSAFDWRLHRIEGIAATRLDPPNGLRLVFTGRQPEHCTLLEQTAPVEAGAPYRMSYKWRGDTLPKADGLRWAVTEPGTGRELAAGALVGGDGVWQDGVLGFSAPVAGGAVRLALEYHRAPGTTRIEGSLWVREVSMDLR
ncbi:MAG: hypothetical protein IT159_12070 [Bryobacterales bacterium]|nr:hypothetical protein [Bryobacterales bacterium]